MYVKIRITVCNDCLEKIDEGKERENIKDQTREISEGIKNIETKLINLGCPFPDAHNKDFTIKDLDMCNEIIKGMKRAKSYMITSDCGVGKSYYASYAMKEILKENILNAKDFSYLRLRDLLLKIRNSYDKQDDTEYGIINKYKMKKYLFLEITDHQTIIPKNRKSFVSDVLFDIIDIRYRVSKSKKGKLSTLIISTLNANRMLQLFDESVVSRIIDMSDKVYQIDGKNRRYNNDKLKIIKVL